METTKKEMRLTPEAIEAIEDILKRRNQAEVKIENGVPVIIEIRRKKKC